MFYSSAHQVPLNQDNIRLVFGLKLKQLRLDKSLSLSDLSQRTGLSISYINEIEKGKKYPKSDKIIALSRALEVEYDSLVSIKLSKKLEPISELLQSNILTELPLDLFGIDPADLLEMLSDAPTKLSAFIGTLIEIARNYNMSVEQFYFSALRTYQEMYDNYFEDLEQEAEQFLAHYQVPEELILNDKYLADLLVKNYPYEIQFIDEKKYPELIGIRSMLVPRGDKLRLLISPQLDANQRAFIYGRELGYQYMKLKNRLNTTHLVEAESFEQLLNNYKASYFASAIIIKGKVLAKKLSHFFEQPQFDGEALVQLIEYFHSTPESFCYRLSNILPKYFGISQLFFLRFNNFAGQNRFDLTKEMHIARKHNPHTVRDEHYCRRWVALTILQELAELQSRSQYQHTLCRMQISHYMDTQDEYFVVAFAKPMSPTPNLNVSVSMGIRLDDNVRAKIKFLNHTNIPKREVNETCERCPSFDCKERMAAPTVLQRKRKNEAIRKAMLQLSGEQ
ncbi:helix-turn-helix domain-containing protein [Runella limosa]|uniref:helix-turn-helix domain-containing protein n=1 Tax=Runella limosa TaxID=370978 RepID=UPI0004240EC8|nr:XRE family transcriptional regulator [Runella limosa]MCA0233258.1 XRE family transcriptional regulator [Bacteroidota bacterium]